MLSPVREDTTSKVLLVSLAGVRGQHLAEVVEAQGWPTGRRIRQQQQRTILGRRGAAEGVLRPRDVSATELPGASFIRVAGGVDRVEVSARRRIHAALPWMGIRRIRDVALARRIRVELDARQIGLKCYAAVGPRAVDQRACEQDRAGVESIVRAWIAERSWPGVLVRHAIEIVILAGAPRDSDACRGGSAQAEEVVLIPGQGRIEIMHAILGAKPVTVDGVAVLPVPDFVRERDVVRVGSPRHPRMLTRCAVHRVEGVGYDRAARTRRIELHLAEAIGDAGGHRARCALRQVMDDDLETGRCVVQVHRQRIAGVHEEIPGGIRCRDRRVRIERHRVRRRLCHSVLRDEREVHSLIADQAPAGVIVERVRIRVLNETVNIECAAPLPGITANATWQLEWRPAWRVELHLHECCARVFADIVCG